MNNIYLCLKVKWIKRVEQFFHFIVIFQNLKIGEVGVIAVLKCLNSFCGVIQKN